jgi:endonuclease-8
MSEGPQVRLRAEWLREHLAGRLVVRALTTRPDLQAPCAQMNGREIRGIACKGKHLFLLWAGGHVLHNHLLMHGRWRRLQGQFLFLPPEIWLGLSVGTHTICNYAGQILEWITARRHAEIVSELGPDVLDPGTTDAALVQALHACPMPVAEALLEQRIVSGLGNVARAETLFRARVAPWHPVTDLKPAQLNAVVEQARVVMEEAYRRGGRWEHRVYQREGEPCGRCHARIRSVRLPPSRRLVFFCPDCQV